MRSRDWPDVETELRQVIELRKELLAEFPDDRGSLRELGLSTANLGVTMASLKRPEEAKALYREALPLWMPLVEQSSPSPRDVSAFAMTHYYLASLLRKDGAIDEARQHYALAVAHELKVVQAVPTSAKHAGYLYEAYHGLGDMALLQKDHAAAADSANKLAELRRDNPADAELAARFFGRCVKLAEQDMALAETDRQALATSYADRAMGHLHEAVRRGYDKVASLKSLTALDPLRERPDFQQLVQELESR
jgi:tetratricopeptide (TPR) repeat protein